MSNQNTKFPSGMAALSTEQSSAPAISATKATSAAKAAKATSDLESMVCVALQALQKDQGLKADEEEPTATRPTKATTSFTFLPCPVARDPVSRRVVSANSCVDESTASQSPPQAQEEDTSLPPAKALAKASSTVLPKASSTVPCSPPVESTDTRAVAPSSPSASPSASPPPSEIPTDEDPTSTDDPAQKAADFSRILADPEGWLLRTENEFAKLPRVDRSMDNEIIVQPNDVLCGRGGETNHHPGNIRYRSLVKAYQKLYLLAKRRDKPKIAQCIVVSVRGVNGRFLKRTKNANKTGGSKWIDVGNVKAREKTSQALREGAPNLRDNVNPPVTTSSIANDSSATSARQILVPDPLSSPSTASTSLPTNAPTALQAMMGWRMPTAAFNSANTSTTAVNVSSSPMPPGSSSSSLSPLDADTEALTAQVFTKNAANLMQHPAFHQLDQARQQEAILFELKNAKATVESAKRTTMSTGKTTSANKHKQGRTSPMPMMAPSASMLKQQQPRRSLHPQQAYQYYHQGQNPQHPYHYNSFWPEVKMSSRMDMKPDQAASLASGKIVPPRVDNKNVDMQNIMRDLMVAKAAAGKRQSLVSAMKIEEKDTAADTTNEHRRKMKKRPAPSSSSSVQSNDSGAFSTTSARARLVAVVSDTGSDVSSSCSSSIASSHNATNTSASNDKIYLITENPSRGGSRLKRLKLRMKNDSGC